MAYQQANRGAYSQERKWYRPKKWLTWGTGSAGEYDYDRMLSDASHLEKKWSDPVTRAANPDGYAIDMGRAEVLRELGRSSRKVQRGTNAVVDQFGTNLVNGATFGLVGNKRIARSLGEMDDLLGNTPEARLARVSGLGANLVGSYMTGRGAASILGKATQVGGRAASTAGKVIQHPLRSARVATNKAVFNGAGNILSTFGRGTRAQAASKALQGVGKGLSWYGDALTGKAGGAAANAIRYLTPWTSVIDNIVSAGRAQGVIPDNRFTRTLNKATNVASYSNPGMAIGMAVAPRVIPEGTAEMVGRNAAILSRDVVPWGYLQDIVRPVTDAGRRYLARDAAGTGRALVDSLERRENAELASIRRRADEQAGQTTPEGTLRGLHGILEATRNAPGNVMAGAAQDMKDRGSFVSTQLFGNSVVPQRNIINRFSDKLKSLLPYGKRNLSAFTRGVEVASPKGTATRAAMEVMKDLQTLDRSNPDEVSDFFQRNQDSLRVLDNSLFNGTLQTELDRNDASIQNIKKMREALSGSSSLLDTLSDITGISKERIQEMLQSANRKIGDRVKQTADYVGGRTGTVLQDMRDLSDLTVAATSSDPAVSGPAKVELNKKRAEFARNAKTVTDELAQFVQDQRTSLDDIAYVVSDIRKTLPPGLGDKAQEILFELKEKSAQLKSGNMSVLDEIEKAKMKLEDVFRYGAQSLPGAGGSTAETDPASVLNLLLAR